MLFGFYILLVLRVVGCAGDQIFVTKPANVGDIVTLTCTRQTSELKATTLFWIRLVAENVPELLGGTYDFDYESVNNTARITTKQEPGAFVLDINKVKLSDAGLYYCIKVDRLDWTLLKGAFLRIKGPEPDITAVTQDFSFNPVRDSVTLQCSVLSDSENKRCQEEHRVYWFRAGSDETHPSFIYTHGNNSYECDKSPETRLPQKCFYSFSKKVSSSDAGTYYCAVATCGEILFGNATKLNIEVVSSWNLEKANTIIYLLCAALALSLVVTAFLIYRIKSTSCDCCNTAFALQTNTESANGGQQSQQRYENSLVYTTVNFTEKKAGKAGRRNAKAAEENCIYNSVRV